MAYSLDTAITMRQYKKGHQQTLTDMANLRESIDNKLSSVYKVKGSLAFASLTSALLVKANEGNVYNITDAFTTTADFVEGAGKKHTAGSNVVVVETTTAVFTESSDNTVDAEKTYYVNQNGGYSAVTPAGNEDPATEGWYELTTPAVYKFDVHAGDLSNVQTLAVPAAANSIAILNEHGQVIDSGLKIATDAEFDEMLSELYGE
ncbi:MAG: hypothetical protein IJR63_06570 [Synergistaceae bacterium]|nr:hypothetical protein [Synergistaceae bacterium]